MWTVVRGGVRGGGLYNVRGGGGGGGVVRWGGCTMYGGGGVYGSHAWYYRGIVVLTYNRHVIFSYFRK